MNPKEESMKSHIGSRIKKLRKGKLYPQQAFAEMIGLTRASVINLEKGRHSPTLEKLYVICAILNCTPNDLFPKIKKANIERKLVSKRRVVVKTKYQYKPVKF